MTEVSLEFDHISKWYRQVSALIEVSFSIGPGVTGLVGQNGAGKSHKHHVSAIGKINASTAQRETARTALSLIGLRADV